MQAIAEPVSQRAGAPPAWKLMPALRALATGGVIAHPTEAVYGLACLPEPAPVEKLLHIKHRSPRKGLILVAAHAAQLEPFIIYPDEKTRARVLATWPGPVTWLVPARRSVRPWLRGDHPNLAVRVSAHPLVRSLCEKAGPLVSTSANPAARQPARDAARVRAYFGPVLDYVLAGRLGNSSRPTEIREARTGAILRPGG